MKTYCIKDQVTGSVYKILLCEEDLEDYLLEHPEYDRLKDCTEYDDAPSIVIQP